jgi:hypothetical protein
VNFNDAFFGILAPPERAGILMQRIPEWKKKLTNTTFFTSAYKVGLYEAQ